MGLNYHNFIKVKGGEIKGFGLNNVGQIGIGNTDEVFTTVDIPIRNVKQISCGNNYTMFLLNDGTLKGVGGNAYGQLGVSNMIDQLAIVDVPISNVKQVSCGLWHTVFLMNDGTVKGVGINTSGQLGIGNTTNQSTIIDIPINNVKQVSCGNTYTMFLLNDGSVKGVGYNADGQLGIGNNTNQSTIVDIPISNVKQVSCGKSFTIFLLDDGSVKGTGKNNLYQLGLADTSYKKSPVNINITNVKQVYCGDSFTMFLLNDGTVKGVGNNTSGQLGIGNTTNQSTIIDIPINNVKQVSCGNSFTTFLLDDGSVKGVGYNADGQLGIGNNTNQSTIVDIPISNATLLVDAISNYLYKTFILHNGEYKKFVNIPRTLENTIPIMTSNTSPSGIASASSVYNKSVQYEAFKAFDNLNDSNGWISYDNSYPQWLSYEFAEPIIISKYSILCRIATPTASPKDWTFEGSNDGVTWYVLDTRVGFTDWVANIFNEFSFENNKEYSKYRIKISSNNGYASYSAISEMKMYKEIAPSQTFWESISTTLPTVEQFVSDGTSDLSILDRKPKTETIVMNDDVNSGAGEVLGDGMVFKKKIDLKKYFDITNLNIK